MSKQFFLNEYLIHHFFLLMFIQQKSSHTIFTMDEIDIRKIFGENVKYYRKKIGLSQEQLAEKLDISPNHLSVIETGGKFVTYKLLEKLIAIFDIMPAALFYVSGTANNDDTFQNKINSIIKSELDSAFTEISHKISKI